MSTRHQKGGRDPGQRLASERALQRATWGGNLSSQSRLPGEARNVLADDPVVAELHRAWKDRERRLDEFKQVVRAAVDAFAEGTGPDPTPLLQELAEMRQESNSVCASLVWTIRDAVR